MKNEELKNILQNESNQRKINVEQMLGIIYSATNGPDDKFSDALNRYINGELTLEELEEDIDDFKYL